MDHHITGFLQFRNDTIRTEEKNDRIEMAAIQDDGVVTKEEKKQIKKIKKAMRLYQYNRGTSFIHLITQFSCKILYFSQIRPVDGMGK